MNYRVLEDLINILVKKAGYSLDSTATLEDSDILTKRRRSIEEKIEELNQSLSGEYVSVEDKKNDEDEKKYLEDTLEIVKEEQEVGSLTEKEVISLSNQIKELTTKIENKEYVDYDKKNQDLEMIDALNNELNEITKALEDKKGSPSELGAIILEAFREDKGFNSIKEELELLVKKAKNAYDNTVNEVKTSNIFELMDEYNSKKASVFQRIEANSYKNVDNKEDINKKCEYHNDRINAYKETLEAIEKREEELSTLIETTRELYVQTLNERKSKESLLEDYSKKIYKLSNLNVYEEEFNEYLDNLKVEIIDDKELEDKYNCDILSYKNEIRTLEMNSKKVNESIMSEEKCLDILNRKLELNENNVKEKIDDEISYLDFNKRLEALSNEQQYYYVNVDVIKNEILNFWSKEKPFEIEPDVEVSDEVEGSMYDEDVLDYTDDSESESVGLEPLDEETEEVNEESENDVMDETTEEDVVEDNHENDPFAFDNGFELLDDFE